MHRWKEQRASPVPRDLAVSTGLVVRAAGEAALVAAKAAPSR